MTCLTLIVLFFVFFVPAGQKEILTVVAPQVEMSGIKSCKIRVLVKVKEGFHIQGDALSDESLIPTTITVRAIKGLQVGKPVFPPTKKFKLEGSEQLLDVFEGSFEILIPLRTEELKNGTFQVEASLTYQACDARTCFFPKTKTFYIPIKVTGG